MKTRSYTARVFLSAFFLSLLALAHGEAQTCVQPPSGLISWWPGDGTAEDIQGVNDGTLKNGATFAAGMVGQAFSFDGVDDFVEAPENGSLDFNGSFSIDLWVKPNGFLPDASSSPMVSKYDYSQGFPNVAYEFSLWPDGRVQFVVTCGTTNMNRRTLSGAIPIGEFSHVAAVYRQEIPSLEIYVNGELQQGDTRRSCSFINQNDIPVRIGKRINSSWESFFYGLIDEVEIFNRALGAEEIQAIYNAGGAGKCKNEVTASIDIEPHGAQQECSEQGGTSVQLTAEVSEGSIAAVNWMINGSPAGDTATISPFLELGQHSIQVDVVTDDGATASATETITVEDTTPPQIDAAFQNAETMEEVTQASPADRVSPSVAVTDVCDPEPAIKSVVGIPSADGDIFRANQTPSSTLLRSNTSAGYIELSVSATDESGNSAFENIQLELVK